MLRLDYDGVYSSDPFKDRQDPFKHLYSMKMISIVARHSVKVATDYAKQPEAFDGQNVSTAVNPLAMLVLKPVARDLCIISVQRALEALIIDQNVVLKGSDVQCRIVQDPSKVAKECYAIRKAKHSAAGLDDFNAEWSARLDTASHVAFNVMLPVAIVEQASQLLVAEFELLVRYLRSTPKCEQIPATEASAHRRQRLVEMRTAAVRALVGVLAQTTLAAVGTFILPGYGTTAGHIAGSIIPLVAI